MSNDPKHAALTNAERWFRNRMPSALVDSESRLPNGMTVRNDRETMRDAEARFLERDANIKELNQHISPPILFSNLLNITFPSIEHFGPEHGKQTSQLAVYCAATQGITDVTEVETLKAAALLHDLGRAKLWTEVDKDASARSAAKAEFFARCDPAGSSQRALREAVCHLIAQYVPDSKQPPQHPLLRCLWDADKLETARFAPNTSRGRVAVTEAFTRLLSPWAQKKATQQKWLQKYGWDLKAWEL